MLLEKLIEYSERLDLPPSLYAEGPARYWINLDAQGRFLPPLVDTADPSSPRTRRGQRRMLPQVVRAAGIKPLLLADKADYTLGFTADEKKAARARACHEAYINLMERCFYETREPDVQAILNFLGNNPLELVQPDESFDPSGIISFQVEGRIVIDNPTVQAFWATANTDPDAPPMQCLVCGNRRPVLARLQAKVKGIPGGQSAGTSLISANATAFESYGLTASLISPTCSRCGEGFTRGINDLLSGTQTRFASGDSVFVFWTREETEFNFLSALEDPDPSQVRALMESVRTGSPSDVDDQAFYALSLSASGGRAVVRDWMDTTVGQARKNLAAWFQGQRIAAGYDGEQRYYGLRALAFATVREPRDLPVTTTRSLTHAVFTGHPLPMDIMARAIRRNRAEQGVTRSRAALIKLVLLGETDDHEEDYMVQLDSNNTDPAYLCGRLLAVLEEAQREAIPRLNTSLTDRFYGTASSAPLSVFPTLVRGSRAHLSKLRRDNPAAHFAIDSRMEDILTKVTAEQGFPKSLNLKEQGIFALGYYHQRAHDREQMREAMERRRNTGGHVESGDATEA